MEWISRRFQATRTHSSAVASRRSAWFIQQDHQKRTSSKLDDDTRRVYACRRRYFFAAIVTRTLRGISSRKSARGAPRIKDDLAAWYRVTSSRGTRSIICYRHERARGPPTMGARWGPRCANREVAFSPNDSLSPSLFFKRVATLTRW